MITFIWSITNTSAAITLLCLAAMPFITAFLGFLFLKEKISTNVWIAIIIAAIGIIIIAFGNTNKGSIFGLLFGILSAVGFSVFSVSLRWRPETPKFTTVAIAGLICAIVSIVILVETDSNLISSSRNQGLFSVHGTLVCVGLILYSLGSRMIPAAELTLLSLTEVIGGIFWVWLPILGINEVPTNNTIIGGFLIFISIIYYSLIIKNNRRFIALN
jgi:RarD protein